MANFAVAVSPETDELCNQVMLKYRSVPGEKKELTLRRLMEAADAAHIRATHPEQEANLRDIDQTINILIKQIDAIIVAQDGQINSLTEKLNKAIEDKNAELRNMKETINVNQAIIAEAKTERDKAVKEAKMFKEANKNLYDLAEERAHRNSNLEMQIEIMKTDLQGYDELKKKHSDLELEMHKIQAEAALEIERAVIAKEREMQAQIRDADRETARLQAVIEQMSG